MSLSDLRKAEQQWRTDDALWAEVLGVVFALGLAIRGGVHVWTALIADAVLDDDIDPHLADSDVTLASPVLGVRDHRIERAARYFTLVVGLGVWTLFAPLDAGRPVYGQLYLAANTAVCIADPAAYMLDRVTNRLATN